MSSTMDLVNHAENAEKKEDFLIASFIYREALELAKRTSDGKSIKEIKKRIKEVNKKAQESFKEVSVETKIPTDKAENIKSTIQSILELKTLEESLFAIGVHPFFRPSLKGIRKTSERTLPLSYQLCTYTTLSEDGHFVSNDGDIGKSWLFQMYTIGQDLSTKLYLNPTFERLKKSKGLDSSELILYLKSKGIFEEKDFQFIEIGMQKYFEKDFISTLHILIPRFESVFLGLSSKMGLEMVSLNRTKDVSTQEAILSLGMLKSDEFKKVWSENFCFQLSFLLFEPLGYALRHKVAHGTISMDECNESYANLAVHLFLVLAATVKKNS